MGAAREHGREGDHRANNQVAKVTIVRTERVKFAVVPIHIYDPATRWQPQWLDGFSSDLAGNSEEDLQSRTERVLGCLADLTVSNVDGSPDEEGQKAVVTQATEGVTTAAAGESGVADDRPEKSHEVWRRVGAADAERLRAAMAKAAQVEEAAEYIVAAWLERGDSLGSISSEADILREQLRALDVLECMAGQGKLSGTTAEAFVEMAAEALWAKLNELRVADGEPPRVWEKEKL